tara:strand:- start:581 stop:922 length:342 start_codon:yes stop_codon:yes gene_type:complete
MTPDGRYVVPWHPTVIEGQGGKFYAVSSGVWIEVPDNTTLEDAKELFCWGAEARKYWDSNYSEEPVKTIEVKGSKGKTYKVTKQGDKWKCQCSGFQFRGKCKHITNLKILLEG